MEAATLLGPFPTHQSQIPLQVSALLLLAGDYRTQYVSDCSNYNVRACLGSCFRRERLQLDKLCNRIDDAPEIRFGRRSYGLSRRDAGSLRWCCLGLLLAPFIEQPLFLVLVKL